MKTKLIILILTIGFIYRLFLTADGNFIFNMDNARDMVDVREMVVLKKLRLTGPTSAIDGFFNGPFWYYLLAVPFIFSGGDPYSVILLEIIFWAIGGFFLLKLIRRWGSWLILPIGILWVASNYVILANLYAFNPNPVILLTPLFIFFLVEYLEKEKAIFNIFVWSLAGLFFNFEMNFGIFTPCIILTSVIFAGKAKLLKQKSFWIGVLFFILALMPQLLFDLKHQFIMSKAAISYLLKSSGSSLNFINRFQEVPTIFFNTFLATMMNNKMLTWVLLILFIPALIGFFKKEKDKLILVSLVLIFIPFLGYLILPVTVNSWHLGGEMIAAIILIGFLLKRLSGVGIKGKLFSSILSFFIIWVGFNNLSIFYRDFRTNNLDPSLFKNEIAAIDYVYKEAKGQNFKVYTYLPSVYDYPYQYLFWWYGKNTYGYIPGEYTYSPSKPLYIPSQEKFQGKKKNFSRLVFLIKEPDRNDTRLGWEGDFVKLESVKRKMIGSIEVEIKKEP